MNHLCHSKTHVRNITVGNILSKFFFQFHKKLQIDAELDFHTSHKSGRATQHGHTQAKLRGKPTDKERWSSLVWFEKVQGRLPFTCSPLLQVSPVQCTQSCYFIYFMAI
jgi:hypothetical protein